MTDSPGMPPQGGILVVDKPAHSTSHGVVAAIRRASGARRVGHAGTLDPLATGVLVVCVGPASRVIAEIQAGAKRYRAVCRLGETTATFDAESPVTSRTDVGGIGLERIQECLTTFRGRIQQVPPMYSAVRHEGRHLYELARAGREVERCPRTVTVHKLEVEAWEAPDLTLGMTVSAGTYVRSIAHDLGQALGVGAHLVALRRLGVGRFTLEDAVSLDDLLQAISDGWWPLLLHALDAALVGYPAMVVDDTTLQDVRQGRAFAAPPPPAGAGEGALARAYTSAGDFVALVRWDKLDGLWRPDRVFPA